MKRKDFIVKIKGSSLEELHSISRELAAASQKVRFKKAVGQLEKTDQLGNARRDLARVMTEIRARA